MSRAGSNVSRYSHALAPVKTNVGTEIKTLTGTEISEIPYGKNRDDFAENTGSIFGEIEVDDDDEVDFDAMRRDTMHDLH
jgi:hypothetical protein